MLCGPVACRHRCGQSSTSTSVSDSTTTVGSQKAAAERVWRTHSGRETEGDGVAETLEEVSGM